MKGIILAGGLGTRLRPLTNVLNKHLLPVFDRPMLSYSLELMAKLSMIDDVMIVLGGHGMEQVTRFVKDGRAFGLRGVNYTYQEGEGGIAAALALTERWVGKDNILVVLGDNIILDHKPIEHNICKSESFLGTYIGSCVWLATGPDPSDYGCPVFSGGVITRIEEKPKVPKSQFAVVGLYMYSPSVFPVISGLVPSARGELEISDVNNVFAAQGRLAYRQLEGYWADAGSSIEGLLETGNTVAKLRPRDEFPKLLEKQ